MAKIELKNVSKVYGNEIAAVKNVTLAVEAGEFMVLVGTTGCGKTTILRLIAGLDELTTGSISIGGRRMVYVPIRSREIAMVFQHNTLHYYLTVAENMAFGLLLRRYPRSETERRVAEAAELLEITHLLSRYPTQLSGGERQKVTLGRALVRRPQVFLLDEPLNHLDMGIRNQIRSVIRTLRRHLRNTTFLYVTHDSLEAMTMGERIAVMREGGIVQVGEPPTLYDHPINTYVARFVGTYPINFLNGKIIKGEDRYYFDQGRFKVGIVDEMTKLLMPYEGKTVILGIRPEDIYDKLFITDAPPYSLVTGVCDHVEFIGPTVFLHLEVGGHRFMASVGPHDRPQPGQDVDLAFDMGKVHFFDPVTQCSILG